MSLRPNCAAYQVSDQATCPVCGLTWDMNDPEPPACNPRSRALTPRRPSIKFTALGRRQRKYPER